MHPPTITTDFPGGNAIVEQVTSTEVVLRPDLRDTEGSWFYWAVRVRGAAGRTVSFRFSEHAPLTVRGAAVSLDGRLTWAWLNEVAGDFAGFSYAFPEGAEDVLLAMTPLYTRREWDGFVAGLQGVETGVLCRSRLGREAPMLRFGGRKSPRARMVVTGRHHACETMGSFAIEGLVAAMLNDRGMMDQVEVMVVPLVDTDGVEAGDQGKNRRPHDHNRDYSDGEAGGIYPETRAIRQIVEGWSDDVPIVAIDVHCPWIRGKRNEVVYQVGSSDERVWNEQRRFGQMLERAVREGAGGLPYSSGDDLAFGLDWNVAKNYASGLSFGQWAARVKGVKLVTTLEVPYANASGAEVLPASARTFGGALARALATYVTA